VTSMFPPAPTRPPGCASQLQIDEHVAGDVAVGGEASALGRHLATCPRCSALVAAAESARAAFGASAPPLRARPSSPPTSVSAPRPRARARLAAGLAACAVVALLVARGLGPAPSGVDGARAKGSPSAELFVKGRDGGVRAVATGDIVRAGEAVQFELAGADDRAVAVLGRDGTGRTSVLFPDGDTALPPARVRKLSFVVDAAPGPETFYVLFCAEPIALAGVRAALERGGALEPPPRGCTVQRVSLDKPAREGPPK
jgi:hypothetical protein